MGRALQAGQAEMLKIFISSAMRRDVLRKERKTVRKAITAHPFCIPWGWEDWSYPGPYPSIDLCVAEAKKSDALVLILGDELTNPTLREFNAAFRVFRMVFNKQCRKKPSARAFLAKLRTPRGLTYKDFQNTNELRSWIIKTLHKAFNPVEAMTWFSRAKVSSRIHFPEPERHELVFRRRRRRF